jgi:hypothetical protein
MYWLSHGKLPQMTCYRKNLKFEAGIARHRPPVNILYDRQLEPGSHWRGDLNAPAHTLSATAKLNNIDPQAWLADVLRRTGDHPACRLRELLPWNRHAPASEHAAAA